MAKILITGGAGYIGSHVVEQVISRGYKVFVVDNFSTGSENVLRRIGKDNSLEILKCDIRDGEQLHKIIKSIMPNSIIHLAGVCSVSESNSDPEKYYDINTNGSINIIDSMKSLGLSNLIFSSTCTIYKSKATQISETDTISPITPYGKSKYLAERMISAMFDRGKYCILRYFNVTGASPSGITGDFKNPSPHLVQNLVRGMLGIEKFKLTYTRVETPDESPVRDYVDVNDLARAHVNVLEIMLNNQFLECAYNIGVGNGYSVLQILEMFESIYGYQISDREINKPRAGESAYAISNPSLAFRDKIFNPTMDLTNSVDCLINWYKNGNAC